MSDQALRRTELIRKTKDENILAVGDLVQLKMHVLGEPPGTYGYVYESYHIGRESGVSVITENGEDLSGFSVPEQKDALTLLGHTGILYQFRSVSYLAKDFRENKFSGIFSEQMKANIHLKIVKE